MIKLQIKFQSRFLTICAKRIQTLRYNLKTLSIRKRNFEIKDLINIFWYKFYWKFCIAIIDLWNLSWKLITSEWTTIFEFTSQNKLIFKQIKKLFFVNKYVIDILRKNFEIIVINCIYKINKYCMLLFVIINHIALNISFYIVFAFLTSKKEKDFV